MERQRWKGKDGKIDREGYRQRIKKIEIERQRLKDRDGKIEMER